MAIGLDRFRQAVYAFYKVNLFFIKLYNNTIPGNKTKISNFRA